MGGSHPAPITGRSSEIPIVDLGPWRGTAAARATLADSVCEVCHHVGFLIVTGHDVDRRLVGEVFELSERLLALPLAEKLLIGKRRSRHFRGWEPEGAEYTNNRPDVYGQQLGNYFSRSYPETMRRHYPDAEASTTAPA